MLRRRRSRRRAAARRALDDFADAAYPSVVPGRLKGKKVAVLFVGPVDQGVSFAVAKGVRDAGGSVVRTRSISVPSTWRRSRTASEATRPSAPTRARITSPISAMLWRRSLRLAARHRSGTRLARSSSRSEKALRPRLRMRPSLSGSPGPQRGPTKALLAGYVRRPRACPAVPAVGTEASGTSPSAIPAFSLGGLVDRRLRRHVGRTARARPAPRRRSSRAATGVDETAKGRRAAIDSSRPVAGVTDQLEEPPTDRLTVLIAARDEEERDRARPSRTGFESSFPKR